ncbi:T9SS type A sorting domain-containing protein [Hyunsoonleella ulvae]|uniref:T9SS type A sorting domain-containing protein n=1 Tax=Hyunsoonleella ulvae TaxID=2799948 RepID=UPI00193A9B71|nr:T9SS type A sorting domain-containing protein [Hyunsoonleella ulvae]
MKKTIFTKIVLACISVLFGCMSLLSQSMMIEASLDKQVRNSDLIIEGKVISQKSYWNENRTYIYTSNIVEVYKVFKGKSTTDTIEVITSGGTVGNDALVVSPSLKLNLSEMGLYMLKSFNEGKHQFKSYGSSQGYYRYNLESQVAVNPFNKKQGISSKFYKEITQLTNQNYKELKPFNVTAYSKLNQSKSSTFVPSGITFSPTTATAGTQTVLTISGTDFGATPGSVWFSNADDGGGTFTRALDNQILTWSDTQITVEIPSGAGTGPIRVEDSSNDAAVSVSVLTITYSELNAVFDIDDQTGSGGSNGPLTPFAYPVRHIGENGNGGFTFELQTNFFNNTEPNNAGARAAFEMALDKWRCETNVNWDIATSATSVDVVARDQVNVVKFDNQGTADDLPDNVLGRCTSWYSGCGAVGDPSTWNAHVAEMDIVFDDEVNWYYGVGLPNLSEFDFESVALHELGHAHQLGHVIDLVSDGDNLDDVMHFAISNSEQQRVLLASNVTAASNVHSRSTTVDACSQPLMTDSSTCNLGVEDELLNQTVKIYPNPASTQLFISNAHILPLKSATLFDLNGRQIISYDISQAFKVETLDITNIPVGVYFVKITSDDASITQKLIIE